jgi:hypothetical protein
MGFVCEFCAVHVCSSHKKDNLSWNGLVNPAPGMTLRSTPCGGDAKQLCNGIGEMVDVAAAFEQRRLEGPAHCRTCAAKAAHKKSLQRPRRRRPCNAGQLSEELSSVLTIPRASPRNGRNDTGDGRNDTGDGRNDRGDGGGRNPDGVGGFYDDYGVWISFDGADSVGPGANGVGRGDGGYNSNAYGSAAQYGSSSSYTAGYGAAAGGGRVPAGGSRISFTSQQKTSSSYTAHGIGGNNATGGTRRLFSGRCTGGDAVGGFNGVGGRQAPQYRDTDSDPDTDGSNTSWSDSDDDAGSLRIRYGAQAAMNAAAARRTPPPPLKL